MKNIFFVISLLLLLSLITTNIFASTRKILCNMSPDDSPAAEFIVTTTGHRGYDSQSFSFIINDENTIKHFLNSSHKCNFSKKKQAA